LTSLRGSFTARLTDLSPLGKVAVCLGQDEEIGRLISELERALELVASERMDNDDVWGIAWRARNLIEAANVDLNQDDRIAGIVQEIDDVFLELRRGDIRKPRLYADKRLREIRASYGAEL
jgi:hypothetical protein